jgi:hypothetical protein
MGLLNREPIGGSHLLMQALKVWKTLVMATVESLILGET